MVLEVLNLPGTGSQLYSKVDSTDVVVEQLQCRYRTLKSAAEKVVESVEVLMNSNL